MMTQNTTIFPTPRFEELETPFYYYDLTLLRNTLQRITETTGSDSAFHIHYAMKANINPLVLKEIAKAGLGADCVSGGEIEIAIRAGIPASKIVYAGVGKTDREIRLALRENIECFNVESIPELEVIDGIAREMGKTARVAFRINPNVDAHTHAKITTGLEENKFGIAMDDMVSAVRLAHEMKGITFCGLHFHIGSQILDLPVYERLCERINELVHKLEGEGFPVSLINVGGGLGIDYDNPDENPIPAFAEYFDIFRRGLKLSEGQEVHFELGRSIVGQCGNLVSRVLYVKKGHTRQFLIVDAGFNDLVRPAMYGAHHCIQKLDSTLSGKEEKERYDVVGPICESSDTFGKDELLPPARRGDFIVFRSAGAYGETMASCYNCRPLPASCFSDDE